MKDRTDPDLWRAIAEIMSLTPDHYRRLLGQHVTTACGHCRACTQGGTGLPRTAWPCPMHRLATLAARIDLDRGSG